MDEIDWLNGSTVQQLFVPQPIKLGGMGIRSLVETSQAAFVGGVDMSLPHFTGRDGVCPPLEDVKGSIEGGRRWRTFLAYGCRTSLEFQLSWSCLIGEATQYSAYLYVALDSPLSAQAESAGDSQVDGSTKRMLVQCVLYLLVPTLQAKAALARCQSSN